ncbi:Regulator of chromosome condensation (RCC1) repeat [Nesidiocoris tenuis]|uniref:Regulator of chromosome condensation (RCC1) repeat n=1 Tax=Nesidiocoris tenuis TaxID=355587 RepID=A0ABN7AGL9_9HEMI|nr:Regulator of chromosome condensation (RCC1) repeat [Nesidiocoris tenuis]
MDDEIGFEKKQIVAADDIVLLCSASTQTKEMLAIVVKSGDLILYGLNHGESKPVVRWIPWYDDVEKKISTLAYNPDGGESLLLACYDQNFYIVPALALLNTSTADEGSSAAQDSDILKLPLPDYIPDEEFVPTALAWWVRQTSGDPTRHCAIIGSSHGQVIAFSIYKGTVIFATSVEGCVVRIEVFSKPELSYIIVTNSVGKQWRITLMESSNKPSDNSLEKKFSSLSINVVQGKMESRLKKSKNISSPLKVDLSGEEWIFCRKENKLEITQHSVGEQRLHVLCNSVINSYNGNIVTVEKSSTDQITVHKLPNKAHILAMTNSFFLLTQDKSSSIDIVSRTMSLCKTDTNARTLMSVEFNNDALIQKISFGENERLLEFFCSILLDQLIILTNQGIYLLRMRKDPHKLALDRILINGNLRDAEKISIIFGLDIQRLICQAGASKLTQGLHSEAKQLFALSLGGSLHHIMALATSGSVEDLLELLNGVKLTPATSSLVLNLKCSLYVYHILAGPSEDSVQRSRQFRNFLLHEEYDAVGTMRTLCRVHLFSELRYVMQIRGLHHAVIPALMTLVPTAEDVVINLKGFWELISDPQLAETLLSRESCFTFHSELVRKHLANLPMSILLNLEKLYNPYQPTVRNFIANVSKGEIDEREWVQTHILICIKISSISPEIDLETMAMISYGHVWEVDQSEIPYLFRPLSAGFRHAAVVVKGIAYMWGATNNGCLGTGPTSLPSCGPRPVEVLLNLRKAVINISCGKSHTVALTNDGVYTWGLNKFGQLGTPCAVESCYPMKIDILSCFNIVDVCAGQYHTLALDDQYRVFSWGWGVHGQLGHGSVEDLRIPKIIRALENKGIVSLSAGHAHSLFLGADGLVHVCGNNSFGQLGTGKMKKSSVPIQVFGLLDPVRFISAGHFRNTVISFDGKLYVWGVSPCALRYASQAPRQRRSHTEETAPHVLEVDESLWVNQYVVPTLVNSSMMNDPIVKVCEGGEHGVALTSSGRVYSWGRNIDGQLGVVGTVAERRNQYVLDPMPVPLNAKIVDICCGWNFTIAMDDSGKLWNWGAMHHIKGGRGTKLASLEGEIVVVNNKNRVLKFPQSTGLVNPVPTILNMNFLNRELDFYRPAKLPAQLFQSTWRERMHFSLEDLIVYYNLGALIFEECLRINEQDASAKIAILTGDYAASVALRLKSITDESQVESIVRHYLSLEQNDIVTTRDLLHNIVTHYWEKKLSFDKLEALFLEFEDRIVLALGSLLFGTHDLGKKTLHNFSTSLKVRITKKILEQTSHDDIDHLDGVPGGMEEIVKQIGHGAEEFIDILLVQIENNSPGVADRTFFSL